ncbi:hypothetical protein S4A8_16697 [Salinisphaera sp. S4-8]|uniref:DUF58 domain-containing protein n=1 Tax=Salinisphaera sp. S4-8 TaxID=633357 RepID=UPI0033419321
MSDAGQRAQEFIYRVPWPARGMRPGMHISRRAGMGQLFSGYASLLDYPDPRRLDLRASVRDPFGMLYTRVYRQRSAINVIVVADLSASMRFADKQRFVIDCVDSVARSAHSGGDAFGFVGIGQAASRGRGNAPTHREAFYWPASFRRGGVDDILGRLAEPLPLGAAVDDEPALAERLPQRRALVFLVSDFHWSTERLARILAQLAGHDVVPVVVWDAREYADLPRRGLVHLVDPEAGRRRTLWMRPALADKWRAAYAERRAELTRRFTRNGRAPLFAGRQFSANAFTDYFLRAA